MDTLKAILNQILLFFEDMGEKLRAMPKKGRKRLLMLSAIFLLLVALLMILCISSCRSTGQAVTAEVSESDLRTRVRGAVTDAASPETWEDGPLALPSDVDVVREPEDTWSPADEPVDDPDDIPGDPDDTDQPEDAEPTPEPPPEDQPEPTAEPGEQYARLKKHDKSEAVTTLQYRLMELGYLDIDEPTNYFGSITETALILFQRQHDLKQDGIAGNETQTILYSDEAQHYCLKEGAEGQDVKALQEQLVDLGYMSEKEVDRVYGPVTLAAVEAFQKRNGLHVDGLAGEKTLELLYSDDAKISKELQKQQEAEAAAQKKAEEEARRKAEEEAKQKAKATKKATAKATAKSTAKSTKSSGSKKTATPKPTKKPTPTPKKATRIDKFINAANKKLGCEYVLGAKGPNKFDCSGFVYWCLKQAGVGGTRLNALGYSRKSSWKKIDSVGSLQRGDILFFRSDSNSTVNHTGIYIGGGNMIDASSGNGKVVKRPLSAYWKRNFVCARRPW